jgi:hypothetical protein
MSTTPIIPLVLATFLAQASEERLTLKGKTNVTIIVQNGESLNSRRLEIVEEGQWGNVAEQAARLYSEGPVESAAIFYPVDGDDPADLGLLLRPGQPPLALLWTYGPVFGIHKAPDEARDNIAKGAGIEMLQGLLDRPTKLSTGQD